MREVKYIRWRPFVLAGVGAGVALIGIREIWLHLDGFWGYAILLLGAVLVHIANLRIQEKDVLLRLTPTAVWTKEIGWQPWSKLLITLEETRQGFNIEIRLPDKFTPRFFERVAILDISETELRQWFRKFAVQ